MEQLVARRAHNPKAAGSSPAPATKHSKMPNEYKPSLGIYNLNHGGCGEVVNTADCGSVIRGFESRFPLHLCRMCGRGRTADALASGDSGSNLVMV